MIEQLATGSIRFSVRYGSVPIAGARVYTSINQSMWYFRGITNSTGTLIAIGVPAGLEYYMISAIGYNISRGSTNVPANGGSQVNVYLSKSLSVADAYMVGCLTICSVPEGAHVYINDSIQELPTPVTIQDLPEGDYIIRLTKDGYEDFITPVTILRDQEAVVTA